ncbi:hypothetical protein KP509_24G033700 [Ceratopteris richardii]|uniref:EF-hand domain-containing protein n=1 Tax=Ceratopteris richardii TaxID=49495 RepID=A0A8T2RWK8_CERRI|nr:hypothetical protein KP509_24G033700 [Ceratopteris richardii]
MLDRDGDGIIRGHDLSAFFDAYVGESLTEEEAASMIAEADSDGDGAVDLHEFQQLTASAEILSSANSFTRSHRAALCRVFNILDADMDGLLGRDDLRSAMAMSGQPLAESELDAMLAASGKSTDTIDFSAFCRLMGSILI